MNARPPGSSGPPGTPGPSGSATSSGSSGVRKLIVLGSTGSIGVNTLAVTDHLTRSGAAAIDVVGLAACSNVETLMEQAQRFDVGHLAIADADKAEAVRAALPQATVFAGEDAAERLVNELDATDVAAAVVGSAGLGATLAAVCQGRRISLSNKETLVAAGALVSPLARQHGAAIVPVDSEHSAIYQCLMKRRQESERAAEQKTATNEHASDHLPSCSPALLTSDVKRIVLTASGGPFRTATKDAIDNATVEDALNHPTWRMGPKITIDSASMMNKALEIVEAHWLFGLPADKIDVIVHPQSIVHSFVEFKDHSVLAQLGAPDMRTPIQYALTCPDRQAGCGAALDWSQLSELTFEPPDFERFPALKLAYQVVESGGTAGAVLNGANEAAVHAFLERRIRFGRMIELVTEALAAIEPRPIDSLQTVLEADQAARRFVAERIGTENAQVTNARMAKE